MPTNLPSVQSLQGAIHDALKQWHNTSINSSLVDLYVVRAFVQEGLSPQEAIVQLLRKLLSQLEQRNEEGAQVLHLHFLERMDTAAVANQLSMSEATFFRRQRDGLADLAKMLYNEEKAAQTTYKLSLEARLELPAYESLVGVEPHLEKLLALLEEEAPPWIVLLHGIGGIGKTALADALVRASIQRGVFVDFGWATARQHRFKMEGRIQPVADPASTLDMILEDLAVQLLGHKLPHSFSTEEVLAALQAQTRTRPHLLVVDNLETAQDLDSVLPALRRLVNPTKLLLTSRERLDGDAHVFSYQVPSLPEAYALALVRQEARLSNLPLLAEAPDAELQPIYETVGGNPLALRLVVGQTHRHALHAVLANLRAARGRTAEQLYTFIYRRVWNSLTEDERQLFLTMPLAPKEGASQDFLAMASGLEIAVVHDALETLVRLNVVDHRAGLRESRYTIHSLTRTFLLEQVVQWR